MISYVFAYMNTDLENISQHCILIVSWDGRVGIASKPWGGRSLNCGLIACRIKKFRFIQNVQASSGTYPDLPTQWVTGGHYRGQNIKLITKIHTVPRLRMHGAILPFPRYAFMVCTGTTSHHYTLHHCILNMCTVDTIINTDNVLINTSMCVIHNSSTDE